MYKVIDSGISVKHVPDWTPAQALREILQNYIDALNEFSCGGEIKYKDGFAIVHDYGKGLDMPDFAFGLSEKQAGSIGQFGEGLKSGILTLCREGRILYIRFGDTEVCPVIRPSENFGVSTLHYQFKKTKEPEIGTKVEVECTEEEFQEAKTYFSYFANEVGINWVEEGRISTPPDFVFINGSRVAKLDNALFSYHLFGEQAASSLSRDRHSVDLDVIKPLIAETLASTESESSMTAFILDAINAENHFEARLRLYPPSHRKEAWKKTWDKNAPPKTCLPHTWDTDNYARYLGCNPLSLNWEQKRFFEEIGVENSLFHIRELNKPCQRYTLDQLTQLERANFERAVKIVEKYYYEPTDVFIEDLPEHNGNYNSLNREIVIARRILPNLSETVDTLVHEMHHKITGEDDCTVGFQNAFCKTIVSIMRRVERGWLSKDGDINLFEMED